MGIEMKHPTPENAGNTQPRVLIVDDTLKNIQLLLTILAKENYDIHFATSGANALESLQTREMDLMLLDIMMPGMDGFEVCRRVKSDERHRDLPIIFFTAKDSVEDKVRGFELGAVDFITKPFDGQEVIARIRTHLELRNAKRTIEQYNQQLTSMLEQRTRELVSSERQATVARVIHGIVHNLNHPLSVITSTSSLFHLKLQKMRGQEFASEQEELGALRDIVDQAAQGQKSISDATGQLKTMIDSLLKRAQSDRSDEMQRFDLNEEIQREISFYLVDPVFKHQLNREVDLAEEPLEVVMVPGEFHQIIGNLFANALDAMHDTSEKRLAIQTCREGDNAVVTITDSGPGIPEELLERIFDPFFSTKAPRGEEQKSPDTPVGTGLGLSMVAETLQNVGGEITASNVQGGGARFTLRIPLAGPDISRVQRASDSRHKG